MSTPGCSSIPPLGGRRKPKNLKLLSFNANGPQKNILELTNCMSSTGSISRSSRNFSANRPRACAIAGYVQLRTDRTYDRKGDHRPVLKCLPTAGGYSHYQNHRLEESVDRVRKIDTLRSIVYLMTLGRLNRSTCYRAKTKLRRASAYPTPNIDPERSPTPVKARVQEFHESWSDLMEEITPSHKAFWRITKALKTEGYTHTPAKDRTVHRSDDAEGV
ncbi:hypothetical protein EVAR_69077_1 [Eumeta japonica]|uniref:Uncharacterized protein n=1 Tax=Eumeta variegata TaxID=151549 RepID=A0A4C1ZIW6_EUMVA|nr:hypothetical protein EVAR_69077_1 [Eumeta japonica]